MSAKRSRLLIGVLLCVCTVQGFHNANPSIGSRRCQRFSRTFLFEQSEGDNPKHTETHGFSRRRTLQTLVTTTAAVMIPSTPSWAGKAELDSSTGQLFSPRPEMLSGGSKAARGGIPLSSREQLKAGENVQSLYEVRFVTYLSRFLLNFDPSAQAWWIQEGLGNSWEQSMNVNRQQDAEIVFAAFAESVEVGLADYFSGPYGSYSSVSAAKAGLYASQPARSSRSDDARNIIARIFKPRQTETRTNKRKLDDIGLLQGKQGVLNLYALLKARYTSESAKRQLAILFSFISIPGLQPVNEIQSLLGEIDNATISNIELLRPPAKKESFRTSSRRGGGYAFGEIPQITVDNPPPLGDVYQPAEVEAIMKPTRRVLRIKVLDGGAGYTSAPQVRVLQRGLRRACQATAILDRQGHVDSIIVLDPGVGYGKELGTSSPQVKIDRPSGRGDGDVELRRATAVSELEYEIAGITLKSGGTGFCATEPPSIGISPPEEDPDWFLNVSKDKEAERRGLTMNNQDSFRIRAEVCEMKFPDGCLAYSGRAPTRRYTDINDSLLEHLEREPVKLLPSSVRPVLIRDPRGGLPIYTIPTLDSIPQFVANLSPRYRACDPIFGGVGRVPVTKGAAALRADEYARLAASGAVCTVLVRTALNPLELIKTKQQLLNDHELYAYARERKKRKGNNAVDLESAESSTIDDQKNPEAVGTIDLIQSMAELRGPLSLFQSADITFLASLVFGSFGFGATELFRRSFTDVFGSEGGDANASIILLLAAGVATVVTAAAASPFEVLRVRSMGLLTSEKWTNVLKDFLDDNSKDEPETRAASSPDDPDDFDLKSLRPKDLLPLWSGFAPTTSRELPFAVAKFLTFDILSKTIVQLLNSDTDGALPIQVGVGPVGLTISAAAGAVAGIAGALVSHPADLILTKTSAQRKGGEGDEKEKDWRVVVKELIEQDGGIANLFVGLGARSTFFFLVIGLQFFLYDFVKNLFQVGQDDLSLVLDVFYAVRAGLIGMPEYMN